MAWFLETAVVSLKEVLEEPESEGLGDAVRVRDLDDLEGLRERIQSQVGQGGEEERPRVLELTPTQLHRLGRLAEDAGRLCREESPRMPMESPSALPEAQALERILEGVRKKVRGHPEHPAGDDSAPRP